MAEPVVLVLFQDGGQTVALGAVSSLGKGVAYLATPSPFMPLKGELHSSLEEALSSLSHLFPEKFVLLITGNPGFTVPEELASLPFVKTRPPAFSPSFSSPEALEEWFSQVFRRIESRLPGLSHRLKSAPVLLKSALFPVEEPASQESAAFALEVLDSLASLPAFGPADSADAEPFPMETQEEEKREEEGKQGKEEVREAEEGKRKEAEAKKEEGEGAKAKVEEAEAKEEERKAVKKAEEKRKRKKRASVFAGEFFLEFFKTVARYKGVGLCRYLCSKSAMEEELYPFTGGAFGRPAWSEFHYRLSGFVRELYDAEEAKEPGELIRWFAEEGYLSVEDWKEGKRKGYSFLTFLVENGIGLEEGLEGAENLISLFLRKAESLEDDALIYGKEKAVERYGALLFFAVGVAFGTPLAGSRELYERLAAFADVFPGVSPPQLFSNSFTGIDIITLVWRKVEELFGVRRAEFAGIRTQSVLVVSAQDLDLAVYGRLVRETKNHLRAFLKLQEGGFDEEFKSVFLNRFRFFLDFPLHSYDLVC